MKKEQTIAQFLNVKEKEFPFIIKDKNGNWIYFEDSKGYWEKWECDSNGNRIYHENSEGYWRKSKRDSNGKLIYFEDSKDGIIFDKRKSCSGKIVEIDGKKYKLEEIK